MQQTMKPHGGGKLLCVDCGLVLCGNQQAEDHLKGIRHRECVQRLNREDEKHISIIPWNCNEAPTKTAPRRPRAYRRRQQARRLDSNTSEDCPPSLVSSDDDSVRSSSETKPELMAVSCDDLTKTLMCKMKLRDTSKNRPGQRYRRCMHKRRYLNRLIAVVGICAIAALKEKDDTLGLRLLKAAKKGDEKEVLKAITDGANVNYKGPKNWTPLHYAACNGHLECVHILVNRGADIYAKTYTFSQPMI